MVAILRDPDEHARIADRCARKFGPAPPRKTVQRAAEQRDDEDASGVARDIIRLSGAVCLGVLMLLGWVAWLYMR